MRFCNLTTTVSALVVCFLSPLHYKAISRHSTKHVVCAARPHPRKFSAPATAFAIALCILPPHGCQKLDGPHATGSCAYLAGRFCNRNNLFPFSVLCCYVSLLRSSPSKQSKNVVRTGSRLLLVPSSTNFVGDCFCAGGAPPSRT